MMKILRSGPALAALLLVCSADAQVGPPMLRATGEVLYTLRLPPTATERLPADAHAVALDPRGRLFLLDRNDGRVWIFGSDGALERSVDLGDAARSAVHMTAIRDGRLVLTDAARRALVVVDPARPNEARTHSLGDLLPTGALLPHPDGGVVVQARTLPDPSSGSWSRNVQFRWFPLDGRAATTIRALAPSPDARGGAAGVSSMPLVAVLPSGMAVAGDPRRYRVELSAAGRTHVLERPSAPRAITAAERSWLEARSACTPARVVGASGAGDPALMAGFRRSAPERPLEHVSAISRLSWSPAGHLWVERPGPRIDAPGPVDVYRPDGTFLGALQGVGVPDVWSPDGRTGAYVSRGADCRTTVTVRRLVTAASG